MPEHIRKRGAWEYFGQPEDPALLAKTMDTLMHGEWKLCELPERWDGRTAERIVQILTGK